MAIVGGNTTATGYGQAYAPPPPPPPIPTYGGLVDDSTAYNASVLGTVPPVAGGGPVISVPDAPLYRDPNNPNVVWNEEYQRWYDTASGLWRNPDTGTWENWAGTQTWNPNTGKQIPTATANIVNQASLQPTTEGMAAAKAIIQGGGGAKTIVATPDRPKTLADWAAEFPDAPGVKLAEDVAGMWQGPGIPARNEPISLAGLENVPAAWLDPNRNAAPPVPPPGTSYLTDNSGNVMYEQNIMGEYVPVERATMSGLEMLASGASALTASPYQLEEFDPVRDRLPGFVNESIEFGTSPVGMASNMFLPFTGASTLGANLGLNIAQDLAFGAAKVGAEKLGAPEPLAYALGFAAAVGSEAATGRLVERGLARNAADLFGPDAPVSAISQTARRTAGNPYDVRVPAEMEDALARAGKSLDSISDREFLDLTANLNTAAGRGEADRIARALFAEDDLPTAMRQYGQDFKYENPGLVSKFSGVAPDDSVTLYRAVAADDPTTGIRPGDWVAIERRYALQHGSGGYGDVGSRLITQKVKAQDIAWAGTDANEWIYAPVALRNPNISPLDVLREASAPSVSVSAGASASSLVGQNPSLPDFLKRTFGGSVLRGIGAATGGAITGGLQGGPTGALQGALAGLPGAIFRYDQNIARKLTARNLIRTAEQTAEALANGDAFTGVDPFTGGELRVTMPDGSVVPGVDLGPASVPGARAVLMPDGATWEIESEALERLPRAKPLTIGDQIDDVLNPNAVTDPRAAMRYPAEEITAPDFRRGSVENDVTVKRSKGTSTLTDQVTGEEVGRVVNEPGTGYRATLADGTDVGTYKSPIIAENAIKGAYVFRKNAETPLEGAVDLARGTRAVKVAGRPINPNIADNIAAAVIDPSPATVERASQMAMSEVTNVDFVGVNLADIAYVLGKDAEGNPITVSKLVEYRKIDEMARNGVINMDKDPLYRVPKDLLNEEYKIQTGGQWVQNAKGEWKVTGGRRPTWLIPKGARPLVYDTRELHQTAMREAGFDNEMIRAILPEGPGLRTADGGYLHGSLLSYMNARDWRLTLDLEKAALQAPDSNTLIRLKLEQAKIAGVDFNPFDPRTSYGLFKFIDDPQVRKAADAAVRNTPLDMATEGSAAHNRAIRSALGQAEPVEMAAHEAEVRAVAREVAQDIPKANIPDSPQMLGLMENAAPAKVKAKANRVGGVAKEVVATPFLGLRNLLLAGDSIIGRQLWGSAVLWPRDTSAAIVRTLRNLRNQDALWRQVDEAIEQRPHMARILVQKGTPGSLEETVTVGKWMQSGKWNPLARIEEVNALMKNMVRLNLDNKITALRRGIPTTPEQLAAQAEYIGVITGRGSGEFLDKHAAKLNAGLFISSRYTASRFQFWGLLVPFRNGYTGIGLADGMLWKQNAARMVAASSVAATTYLLLGQVPGVTIETDPRASKFGKFNWRGKWYDFTGAYTDPIRLFSQMATETGISESGSKYKFDRGYGPLSNVPGLGAAFSYMEARMPPQARLLAEGAGWMQPFEERQNIPGLPAWTTKYTPLSLNAMFDMWKQTNDLGDGFWNVVDSAALLAGFGVNPEGNRMAWEKQVLGDAKTRAALDDPDFWKTGSKRQSFDDLTKTGLAYISAHPEIFGEKPGPQMAEFKRNAEIVAAARAAVRGEQLSDDWKFENGELSPDDYRIRESVRARTLSRSISGVYGPYEETESTDVVDLFFDAIDRATYTVGEDSEGNPVKEVDWEAVDLFRSKLSKAERAQLERYFEISSSKGTPVQQRMDADRKLIEDSGFWDLKRTYYAEFVKDHPELPDNYDDFRDQAFREAYEKVLAETGSAGVAYDDASKAVSARERELGFTDGYKNTMLYPWVMENQDAAKAAAYWKYYTPDNAAEKAIFGQDPSEIASATEIATVKAQVITPAYNAVIADAWHAWASQNVSLTLSDGRTAADFPTHDKFNESLRDEALAAKEKELGRKLTQTEENEVKASVADVTAAFTSATQKNGGTKPPGGSQYLSQATISRLDAIGAMYKENPELVQKAYDLGIITDIGSNARLYLAWKYEWAIQ